MSESHTCFAFLSNNDLQINLMLYFYNHRKSTVPFRKIKTDLESEQSSLNYQLHSLVEKNIIKKRFSKITDQMIGYSITRTGIMYSETFNTIKEELQKSYLCKHKRG